MPALNAVFSAKVSTSGRPLTSPALRTPQARSKIALIKTNVVLKEEFIPREYVCKHFFVRVRLGQNKDNCLARRQTGFLLIDKIIGDNIAKGTVDEPIQLT